MKPSDIKKKINRFRILIIGRANAGKTTILQRVCNTRENPEIYNSRGGKIDEAVLVASTERGEHDINNEMVFRSNPGFIFHDSRGFEAGGESEFDKVKEFIADRSKETSLTNRLHVIWFCIPMSEANRAFTEGEKKFFSQCDTGSIPVIILFTKFDALYDTAYAKLKSRKLSIQEAAEQAPRHAEELFATGPQLKFLYQSDYVRHHPKCHICLPNMNKDDADCGPLIKCTAETLDNEVLQQLFVSTQQTNLEVCMKYAVQRTLPRHFASSETTASQGQRILEQLGDWFPHLKTDANAWDYNNNAVSVSILLRARAMVIQVVVHCSQYHAANELGVHRNNADDLDRSHRDEMYSRLLSVVSGSSRLENNVQLISAAVIIFEHSFYIFDKRRYLKEEQKSDPSFHVALEQYIASSRTAAVREGVSVAVMAYKETVTTAARTYEEAVTTATRAYEEAVRTGVHAYPGKSSTWMAKLPFEPFKRKAQEAFERSKAKEKEAFERSKAKEEKSLCSQAEAELTKTILEIALNNRLPRP